ncbi:MAG: hypothetical protein IPQ09_30445 [Myxococcales bacterium]|nr:hypothetical protein [Myxococcales bacterium]
MSEATESAKEETAKDATQDEARAAPPVDPDNDPVKKRYEMTFGFVIALFAAVLALNELAAGQHGDDELQLNTERRARTSGTSRRYQIDARGGPA